MALGFPPRWSSSIAQAERGTVASLCGSEFEAYARILHPAYRELDGEARAVRWRSISERAGVELDLTVVSFPELSQSVTTISQSEQLWDVEPSEGGDPNVSLFLAGLLRFHTRSPDRIEFAVWEGWGKASQVLADAPELVLPNRRYFCVRGPISLATDVTGFRMPPSLWWSIEREWLVASGIDQQATYVGGTERVISVILSSSLEALRVKHEYRITSTV